MMITLNLAGEIPIYQQIRDQVISAIAAGKLQAGDALPSVRQLAAEIGVNMHTVNKAYALLKADGYLTIDRRSGAKVAEHLLIDEGVRTRIQENLQAAATEALSRGMSKPEFISFSEAIFDAAKENLS